MARYIIETVEQHLQAGYVVRCQVAIRRRVDEEIAVGMAHQVARDFDAVLERVHRTKLKAQAIFSSNFE